MKGMERQQRILSWCAALAACALLAACGTLKGTAAPAMQAHDAVAVGAIGNYTETPSAGQSAASIAANVLRADGLADVRMAPDDAGSSALFDTAQRSEGQQKLAWAQSQQIRYVLTGSVEEWHYKTGVDGEPVVGLTFELTDVSTGKVVWSTTGTRNGWSRSSLAGTATALISRMLAPLAPRR